MKLTEHILRKLQLLGPKDKLVRVISWWPSYFRGELAWPCLLIDRNGYRRETSSPIWDRARLRALAQNTEGSGR